MARGILRSVVILTAVIAAALCHLDAQTPLTRYPYLQNMRPDRVTVVWTTPELAAGTVRFSTDRSLSQVVSTQVQEVPRSVTRLDFTYYRYQAELTGLTPNTDYFYQVLMDGEDVTPGDDFRFRTAGPGPFTFLAFGDSGEGSVEQVQLAQRMFQERPALVLHTGDIAYPSGEFDQFRNRYVAIYSPLMRRVPFFPTPGNHEYDSPGALPYLWIHAPPGDDVPVADRGRYYSFDWGDAHFISLNTNTPFTDAVQGNGAMLQWLESDLNKTHKLWKIAYFHHPVRPNFEHENNPTSTLERQYIEPIFDKYDVQLVLSGHEHNYQQEAPRRGGKFVDPGQGTVNIITGGGGAPLYAVAPREGLVFAASTYHYLRGEVAGPRITLHAIDINGQEIDNVSLAPLPILVSNSAVNSASFTTSLAPGALVSIFGRQMAVQVNQASGLPLPTELSGTSVTLNGRRLPLLYVSRTQINAQILFDVQGPATLRVSYPGGFAEVPISISEPAPAIFSTTADLGRSPAVIHLNGTLVSDASPARPGEAVSVFLTGLGRPEGEIAAGQPAPLSPLLPVRGPIEAQIGALSINPTFAGLAPGFAGLYQMNMQLPQNMTTGTYALRVVARGVISNTVSLAVRQ